jgi:hypothetical protein
MKKKLIIMLLLCILTGCTVVRIDTNSIDNIVSVVLSKDNKLYNRIGKGYKYYVPRGVNYIDTEELNERLYSNGVYYYLYVDAISYYHKREEKYVENKNAYYSRKIKVNKKSGYLEINKEDGDNYFVEFFYNYAKIEAKVPKDELNNVVLNASYILSTVKFNNNVVKLMLNDEYFINKEEKYDLFEAKKKSDYFLEVVDKKNK